MIAEYRIKKIRIFIILKIFHIDKTSLNQLNKGNLMSSLFLMI